MEIITLTSDFGVTTEYTAAMKGVIYSINRKVKVIDITHSILPQNIHQGAFVLYSAVDFFPEAIHIGVVDPEVGTSRSGLIFKCHSGVLIGPDNGLLLPAAEKLGIERVFKINSKEFCLENISSTFHGRDVFAPIAAHISLGIPIEEMGDEVNQYHKIDLFDIEDTNDNVIGKVLNVDDFGNIITNFSQDIVEKYFDVDETMLVTAGPKQETWKIPYKTTYNTVPVNELLATISSSGFLELAGNQCSAKDELNLEVRDNIMIQKLKK